jgi:zinc transport system permease protein
MDDFLWRAFFGGAAVALMAGPIGCFVVWRRTAYFGEAVANASLLGVALGLWMGISPLFGIVATCVLAAVLLVLIERRRLPSDAVIGMIAHATLALGLVVVALMQTVRIDLMGLLVGDILAITRNDLLLIAGTVIVIGALLGWLWRPLLSATINAELAAVEGVNVERTRILFMLIVSAMVAIGMKVVGILLIVALLIIPAAAARGWSRTPDQMAFLASLFGFIAVILGLAMSLYWDTPAGPSIVVAAAAIFAAAQVFAAAIPRTR